MLQLQLPADVEGRGSTPSPQTSVSWSLLWNMALPQRHPWRSAHCRIQVEVLSTGCGLDHTARWHSPLSLWLLLMPRGQRRSVWDWRNHSAGTARALLGALTDDLLKSKLHIPRVAPAAAL